MMVSEPSGGRSIVGWLRHELGGGVRRWHYLLLFAFQGLLFLSFQHGDIGQTGGASFVWLEGHFRTFYDRCLARVGIHHYLPSTTWVFAVWNLPLKLLGYESKQYSGPILLWFKILPTLFLFGSVPLLNRIGQRLGLPEGGRASLGFVWLSSPILVFSQFVFGQYDSLTVFFTLLGWLLLLDRRVLAAAAVFGLAFTFKYFAAVVFIPLLLLAEKRPLRLVALMVIFLLPACLEALPFLRSPAFQQGVVHFGTATRSLNLLSLGSVSWSVLVVLFCLVCGVAYYVRPDDERDARQWAAYLPLVAVVAFFCSVLWNPQWVLFLTPFVALTTMLHPRRSYFLVLDGVQMFAYLLFTVLWFPSNVDAELMLAGVWRPLLFAGPLHGGFHPLGDFVPSVAHDPWLFFSLFVACAVLPLFLKRPSRLIGEWSLGESVVGLAGARTYLSLGLFFVAALLACTVP